MKRLLVVLVTAIILAHSAFALKLELTPGSLPAKRVMLENTRDASLTLTGTAAASDLSVLRNLPAAVASVDLSSLEVEGKTLEAHSLAGLRASTLILPATLSSIGEGALAGSAFTSLSLPASLLSLGDYALAGCDKLESVKLPAALSLGKCAFKDCKALRTVEFSAPVAVIPESAFEGCSKLSSPLPEGLKTIGKYAWRGTALSEINLSKVLSVGDFAFADMPLLSVIIMPADEEASIGAGAFFNDPALSSLPQWEQPVATLMAAHSGGMFSSQLNSSEIGEGAYAGNNSIDSITLGPGVHSIGHNAFRNATGLKSVNVEALGSSLPSVESDSFSGLENEEGRYDMPLYVKEGTQDAWAAHPVWSLFTITKGTTGSVGNFEEGVTVDIKRVGGVLSVRSSAPLDYIAVYTAAGVKVCEATPGTATWETDALGSGDVLMVQTRSGGQTRIAKVI